LKIDALYWELGVNLGIQFLAQHNGYYAGEILIFGIIGCVILWYFRTVNGWYSVLLGLMRRISPAAILASPALEQYLFSRTAAKRRIGMTPDERIIDTSLDSIIFLNPAGLVDMINPAFTSVFGFTPEQIIGQPLTSLIRGEHGEKIEQQIKLMAEHQSGHIVEDHTVCVADDDTEISCQVSLLMLCNGDDISGFVAILRDETALLQQQEAAEDAKKQSETLLFQILPRDIVARLNAGDKDISFSIETATVMFIDIVKFSEYAANLTPQEIMGNLSQIFASFDEACAQYPLLMKIKLIGDVYMCAGGIFALDVSPAAHAEQMVRFALDALQIIDDLNLRLTALLSIRIGINTGGPILAGVLGIDRPVFDIIGDPINVSARLQSTDVPGKVQISESTQMLVANMDFPIEYRGEIELKGKGKQKTYLIDPQQPRPGALQVLLHSTLEDITRLLPPSPGQH
jgi:PAS domain S-box-containing protein